MTPRSIPVLLARALNALFFLTTAAYCALCYVPFAYEQFIRPELVAWPSQFVSWYHYGFWLTLFITALTIVAPIRKGQFQWSMIAYLAVCLLVGVWLLNNPVMSTVDTSARSLVLALVALSFPITLAVIDHGGTLPGCSIRVDESRLMGSCLATAGVVWAVFATSAVYRVVAFEGTRPPVSLLAVGLCASLLVHVLLFCGLFLGVALSLRLIRLVTSALVAEYWALIACGAVAAWFVLRHIVFPAVTFTGFAATLLAAVFATCLALCWSALVCGLRCGNPAGDSMDIILSPIRIRSGWMAGLTIVLLTLPAMGLSRALAGIDWDFLLQKLSVLLFWGIAFAATRRLLASARASYPTVGKDPAWRSAWPSSSIAVPLVIVAVYWGVERGAPSALAAASIPYADYTFDRYASIDPSFQLVRDATRTSGGATAAFYAFLRRNSTIAHVEVPPVNVDFVHPLTPPSEPPPHVFLFVVDSLRRDYLSPYNDAVSFTPGIAAFANDSFVFDRAFTRYGATGLAVPSIWTGGMTLHMQYISPYAPMNTLAKLLDAGGYQRLMSLDGITARLSRAGTAVRQLDRSVRVKDFRFCNTLSELQDMLRSGDTRSGPIFAYSLPQDIHMSNAFTQPVPDASRYQGFFPPVASEVQRIDECFGRFVDFLKLEGLFDDSIVILTSDHGDSLGEEGRVGHAYTLFPEVIRIPLIVHLPPALARGRSADLSEVAFSSDITPTLYSLLGYEPADLGPLYGAPLFGDGARGRDRRRDPFLIASSYGPVYGMLRHNGRFLYIADAVGGRDYAYDLSDGHLGARVQITPDLRRLNWDLIRGQVSAIATEYHFVGR